MPYKSGDNASFTDGKNTIELFVNETYRSGDYKQHKVWNMEFPCDMDARVILSGASNPNQILINSEKRDIPDESGIFYNYALSFFGNDWSNFDFYVSDNEIVTDRNGTPYQLLSGFNNGYKEYTNVLKLEMDTATWTVPKMIYQVYIAESVGIIQFTETTNRRTWNLTGK